MDNLSCGIATSWVTDPQRVPQLDEIIQRDFAPGWIPLHVIHRFRWMASTDSAQVEKVDGLPRIGWTAWFGFSGRLAPDSLVAFGRNTQVVIDGASKPNNAPVNPTKTVIQAVIRAIT
jgi:hypothetical protein